MPEALSMSYRPLSKSWAEDDDDDFDLEAWKSTADTSAPSATSLPPLQLPAAKTEPSFTITIPAKTPDSDPVFKCELTPARLAPFQCQEVESAKFRLVHRALADLPAPSAYLEMSNWGVEKRSCYSANWNRMKVAGGWDCRDVAMFRTSGLRYEESREREEIALIPEIALETEVKAKVTLVPDIVLEAYSEEKEEPLMWNIELDDNFLKFEKLEMPVRDENNIAHGIVIPPALLLHNLTRELKVAFALEKEDAQDVEEDIITLPGSPPPTYLQELEMPDVLEEYTAQGAQEDATTHPDSPPLELPKELEKPLDINDDFSQNLPDDTTTTPPGSLLPTPSLAITIPPKTLVTTIPTKCSVPSIEGGYYSETSPIVSSIIRVTLKVFNTPICTTQLGISPAAKFAWQRSRRSYMEALRSIVEVHKKKKQMEASSDLTQKLGLKTYLRAGWCAVAKLSWGKAAMGVATCMAQR
jgi:hypothetical protein